MRQRPMPGFTLIEATIVVAILATLAAVAIPLYGIYISRTQATVALGEIAAGKTAYEPLLTTRAGIAPPRWIRLCCPAVARPEAASAGRGRAKLSHREVTLSVTK